MNGLVLVLAGFAVAIFGARMLGRTDILILDVDREFILGWALLAVGAVVVFMGLLAVLGELEVLSDG